MSGSGLRDSAILVLEWVDSYGAWAPLVFVLIDIVAVVTLMPGLVFTLGAGFLFGPLRGALLVLTASTVGALIAFELARFLVGTRAADYILRHPKLATLDQHLSGRGWRFILLTRLLPFFPFKLSNYFFGLMRFSRRDLAVGTFFGGFPIAFTNAYVGSLAADLTSLRPEAVPKSPTEWLLTVLLALLAISALFGISRYVKRALYNGTNVD